MNVSYDEYLNIFNKIDFSNPDEQVGLSEEGLIIQAPARSWFNFVSVRVTEENNKSLHEYMSALVSGKEYFLSDRSIEIINDNNHFFTVNDILLIQNDFDSTNNCKSHLMEHLKKQLPQITKSTKYSTQIEKRIFAILQKSYDIIGNGKLLSAEIQNKLYQIIIQYVVENISSDSNFCKYLASFMINNNISFTANTMDKDKIIIYLQCLGEKRLKCFNKEDLLNLIDKSFSPRLQSLLCLQGDDGDSINTNILKIEQEIMLNNKLSKSYSFQDLNKAQKIAFQIIEDKELLIDYNEYDLCFLLKNEFIDADLVLDIKQSDNQEFEKILNLKQLFKDLKTDGYEKFLREKIVSDTVILKTSDENFRTLIKNAIENVEIITDHQEREAVVSYIINNNIINEEQYKTYGVKKRDDVILNFLMSLVKIENDKMIINDEFKNCKFLANIIPLVNIKVDQPSQSIKTTDADFRPFEPKHDFFTNNPSFADSSNDQYLHDKLKFHDDIFNMNKKYENQIIQEIRTFLVNNNATAVKNIKFMSYFCMSVMDLKTFFNKDEKDRFNDCVYIYNLLYSGVGFISILNRIKNDTVRENDNELGYFWDLWVNKKTQLACVLCQEFQNNNDMRELFNDYIKTQDKNLKVKIKSQMTEHYKMVLMRHQSYVNFFK